MHTFKIHTWSCASCGYQQDFDPADTELFKKVFKGGIASECPSCKSDGGLTKETDPEKKMGMNCCEQSDIDAKQAELNAEATRKLESGAKEYRLETDGEKGQRVDNEVEASSTRTKAQSDKLKGTLTALPNLNREFPVMRDETADEKTERIAEHIGGLKAITTEELAALKTKYEDL